MKKTSVIIAIIILAVFVAGYLYFTRNKASVYEFVFAKRMDINQEVSVTGKVSPAKTINLAFERSGKIANINIKVGDKVEANQVLATLDSSELLADLAQAEANVKIQKSKLDELRLGTRPEEIQIQEIKVENAEISLADAKTNLNNKIKDAYTQSDDAVRNKVDQFFSNPRTSNPKIIFSTNYQSQTDLENGRLAIESALNLWALSLDQLDSAKINLDKVKSFLDIAASAVNGLTTSSGFSQTIIDGWKAAVSTGRNNINTAIGNLSTAEEKLSTVKANLKLEQNTLILKKAGATIEQITAQEAQLEQSEASVKSVQAQIEKTIISSPVRGIITKQEAEMGEIASANTAIISLISDSQFQIEANVPEADIAKVKIGNSVEITLDAYGDDIIFAAKVVAIDPAETIIDGVATYKTTIYFDQKDERIRAGMTANIDILTNSRSSVIVIPQRTIIEKGGDKFVQMLVDGEIKEIKVETGLSGSDGDIEIISGLNEGDKIIYGSY